MTHPPVCSYEGSDYQKTFWDEGGRAYEDLSEALALKRLLPPRGKLMLELGAGAGRNTKRYAGFERVVLLDYSLTQLRQAQERLGVSERYVYVAADIYRLPFRDNLFDGATMIRALHHMADAPKALAQVYAVMQKDSTFALEFANKRNLKAILRYWLKKQDWNPFSLEPVEFVELNFNFHPKAVRGWLTGLGFEAQSTLAVSHFRLAALKRLIPARFLAALDGLLQPTGAWLQFTPSIFIKAVKRGGERREPPSAALDFFKCPDCGGAPLQDKQDRLLCAGCGAQWKFENEIYDFRQKA